MTAVDALAAAFICWLIWAGRRDWRWLLVGAATGGLAGIGLTWWFGDEEGILGVPPTQVDRWWAIVTFVGVGIVVVSIIRRHWAMRVVAVVAALSFGVAGGLAINRDGGLFPKIADVLGVSDIPTLNLSAMGPPRAATRFNDNLYRAWVAPAGMPGRGIYGNVTIPGVKSHFNARPAIVYLPPAARVADPPALPVLIVMSGQGPGAAPYNVVDAGHFISTMNDLARTHHGLAPIVVIPDQLRSPTNNPMCVNGPLGNSATYLTVDVPRWVRKHFRVENGARAWTVAGFSEGGTCSVQLAAKDPNLFGSFIDVSGQRAPELGSVRATVQRGFRGDVASYLAALPENIMRKHGQYADTEAFLATGANDFRYGPALPVVASAAKRAGMHVTIYVVAGASHDWSAAARGLARGARWLMPLDGLAAPVN
ncbi:MAG TPA: alpha/beta hydrolase-fold protein [Galbitalea sp.]